MDRPSPAGKATAMNAAALSRRHGREPVSAYISDGWSLLPLGVGGVAFHRVGRYAITVGAPLAPQEHAAKATTAFRQHCQSKGWHPVIFQSAAPVDGLRSHLIAREAFLDVGDFSLGGSAIANTRHSVSRARRDGTTVSWRRWSGCDTATRDEIKLISATWRGGRPELTFTYGRLQDIADDAWVGLALAPGGRIEAFSTWRPLPAGPGMVLDLMRRRNNSTPGAVELMIVEAVELARSEGLAWVSLGAVSQSDDLPRWLRIVLASAAACGGSGLSAFKEKFRPRWEDRYLALPARSAAVAGVLALAIAHVRGARVRPQPAGKMRPGRPALRWAATSGMTAGLCAYGLAAAATDVGWQSTGPIQLSLTSAADRVPAGPSAGAPSKPALASPAPAAKPAASGQPVSVQTRVVGTSPSFAVPEVEAAEPDLSVVSFWPVTPCTAVPANHPAAGAPAASHPASGRRPAEQRAATTTPQRTTPANGSVPCVTGVPAKPATHPVPGLPAHPASRPTATPTGPARPAASSASTSTKTLKGEHS
jgi:hypothetical protein